MASSLSISPALCGRDGLKIASIFRTRDLALIRRLCLEPSIYRQISDDFSDPNNWQPPASDDVVYLLATNAFDVSHASPLGFSVFMPETLACWKSHVAFLPRAYGPLALFCFREMLAWMFEHTPARRLVGEIDRENRLAIAFAKRAGFVEYGLNPKSVLRGGELRDQVCLGISK